MTEKAKEARRMYEKAWRAKNPDKVRERNRRYWERKAAAMQEEKTDGEIETKQ